MRRGYEAAFNNQNSSRRGPMNQDKANLNIQTILTPLSQLSELWLDGMRKWIDVLSVFVPRDSETTSASAPVHPAQVTVLLSSDRPTEVSVKLFPGIGGKEFVAGPLTGKSVPPIDPRNISIKRDQKGNLRIYLKIGKDQPSGKYEGPILKESDDSKVGTLTVTIDPDNVTLHTGR
jgi:hypothetical protein